MHVQDDFKAENGDTAINEWTISGTQTGPLEGPEGTIPATGKGITVRGVDALTGRNVIVRNIGRAIGVSHIRRGN